MDVDNYLCVNFYENYAIFRILRFDFYICLKFETFKHKK
jgi:hypothetical protein